jgi:transposase
MPSDHRSAHFKETLALELPETSGTGLGAGRGSHPALEEEDLAYDKKKAQREGRTIVFIDESGLTQKPHRVSTWSPIGQTPLLFHHFTWDNLAAIAGLSWTNFYFRLFEGSIKSPQVIEFLGHLQRHIPGKLLIIWDGAAIHRSKLIRGYLKTLKGKIWVERLPAYAPELNPVEYLWAYWKERELPNLCTRDLWQLSGWAAHALRRMRRKRKRLIVAFWKQAELWP